MAALADRDSNITATSQPQEKRQMAAGEENKPQQQKSMFEHKGLAGSDKQYVSPSDNIMSPASQKLSSFKQRQISKGAKNPAARTLFARTASGSSGGFDDVEGTEAKKQW